jgi:excisionase family DNA binding protein
MNVARLDSGTLNGRSTEPGHPGAHPMNEARGQQKTMSRTQVARLFQVSASTVTRWAREGKIPAQRTLGGHYRFSAETMLKLAAEMAGGSFEKGKED